MTAFNAIMMRDIVLGFRAGGGAFLTTIFFAIVVLVFAFAVGPDRALMSMIAAPVLWAAALLSTLVSFDRIFQTDFEDGTLDVIVETADLLEVRILAKAAAHWVTSCLPLIIITPLLALLLSLPSGTWAPLIISLIIGTPALSLIGTLVAGLTVSLRRVNILITILAMPLFTPALIFGVGAGRTSGFSDPAFAPALLLLGACVLISLIMAPLAGAAAIRANLD